MAEQAELIELLEKLGAALMSVSSTALNAGMAIAVGTYGRDLPPVLVGAEKKAHTSVDEAFTVLHKLADAVGVPNDRRSPTPFRQG